MSVVVGNNLSVGRSGEVGRDRDDLSPPITFPGEPLLDIVKCTHRRNTIPGCLSHGSTKWEEELVRVLSLSNVNSIGTQMR